MAVYYFSPSSFEAPCSFRKKTRFFGMGEVAAKKLAEKVNREIGVNDIIVVYGCAGGLRKSLKAGETFIISSVFSSHGKNEIYLPDWARSFAKASVYSSTHVLKTISEKDKAFEKYGADLVDCESFFFLNSLKAELKKRTVIVRGVIDGANDELLFLNKNSLEWRALLTPSIFISFLKFLNNFRKYKKGMRRVLTQIEKII